MDHMLCPSCNTFRPTNNGPCPPCKMPAPLAGEPGGQLQVPHPATSWGGPITPASSNEWDNQMSQGSYQGGMHDNTLWGQVMASQSLPGAIQQQYLSMLPTQYQGGIEVPQQTLKVTSSNLSIIHTENTNATMMPALPGAETPIH